MKNVLAMEDEFSGLIKALGELDEVLGEVSTWGDDKAQIKKSKLQRRLATATNNLIDLAIADFGDMVRWVEREDTKRSGHRGQRRTAARGRLPAPDGVGPVPGGAGIGHAGLRRRLQPAALPAGLRHHHARVRRGHAVRLHHSGPAVHPRRAEPEDRQERVGVGHGPAAVRPDQGLDGRALLLFTSWTSLHAAYDSLAPHIRALGHRVYQQDEMPSQKLGAAFTADEHSVLFAVKSFYTGIDIQGRSLILNVMDKMPFPVPTEIVFQARCEVIDERVQRLGLDKWREGSFNRLTVPTMALTLFQGFGRLIRHTEDRGMVAIFDPRLTNTNWGKSILRRLPKAPLITELPEAIEYLEEIAS
jgi:hypothetical protein